MGGVSTDDDDRGRFAPGLTARGHLGGQGRVRIEGRFEGTIELLGQLEVAPGAEVTAPIRAQEAYLGGEVRGNVTGLGASSRVVVLKTGRLIGDVRAAEVGIDDGGALHGSVDMVVDIKDPS